MIRVLSPGSLSSVQDLGRPGYVHSGVAVSGALDAFSLRLGNRLLGNEEGAAAIEMTLSGGTFEFLGPAAIAASGADLGVSPNCVLRMRQGEVLRFGAARLGARCYLCVRGGVDVVPVLGSRSTHVASKLGGLVLSRGDLLEIGRDFIRAESTFRKLPPVRYDTSALRYTRGPQHHWFAASLSGKYTVTAQANRTGIRLHGPLLPYSGEMESEGVLPGSIQITPDGQPIILMNDHGITGGYPVIGTVIAADLHLAGQLRPGDRFVFHLVGVQQALAALRERERCLESLMPMSRSI